MLLFPQAHMATGPILRIGKQIRILFLWMRMVERLVLIRCR